jgi:16S rRNA (guanine527-N7)-methyltransferase
MENRDKFVKIFLEKNSQINLSAIRDEEGVRVKHIQDSLELDKVLPLQKHRQVCDVWTGGGFPLLPLAITHPEVSFIGVDSVGKKVKAVNLMIEELWLKNVKALWLRAEDYTTKFDVVTARAVAYMDKLLPWILHLVRQGGHICLYKQYSEDERKELLSLCKRFSLKLEKEHRYELAGVERVIYVLRK